MCGITGFISPGGQEVPSTLVEGLLSCLQHRGPDASGWLAFQRGRVHRHPAPWPSGAVQALLAHRRLSIIDLSEAGGQPMAYHDGRLQVAFNGELYNFLELREELRNLGMTFKTQSDTEVLLAGYQVWGTEVFARLVGMFAIVLLDVEANKVLLARDGFGIKPLYLASWRDGVAFGSELKTILSFPGISREVDPQALCDFLRTSLTDHGEHTLFRNILQLKPGHWLEVDLARPMTTWSPREFWTPTLGEPLELSRSQIRDELRDRFLESVRLHLRSDVPVGSALSGGIDSSAIVMAMRKLEPNLDIHTFSFLAEEPHLDEGRWARTVADAASATVHAVRITPEEVLADMDQLVRIQELPFGSLSIYAQNRVFRLAAEHGIKVMLDGQGADEMLGGYPAYSAARLASMVRAGQWSRAARFLLRVSRLPGRGRLPLFLGQFLIPPRVQAPFRAAVGEREWMPWVNRGWFEARGASPVARYLFTRDQDVLRHQLRTTLAETSLPMLLRYEDRNSMAYSVESRVPFLTSPLADFILRIPEELLIDDQGTTKSIFREAMRGLVPDVILDRKDKIGFQTPGLPWARQMGPWIRAKLQEAQDRNCQCLDVPMIMREWDAVDRGEKPFGNHIWRWVSLIAWAGTFDVAV